MNRRIYSVNTVYEYGATVTGSAELRGDVGANSIGSPGVLAHGEACSERKGKLSTAHGPPSNIVCMCMCVCVCM